MDLLWAIGELVGSCASLLDIIGQGYDRLASGVRPSRCAEGAIGAHFHDASGGFPVIL